MPYGPRSTRSRPTSTPERPGDPPLACPRVPWGGPMEQETRRTCMTLPPGGNSVSIRADSAGSKGFPDTYSSDTPAGRESRTLRAVDALPDADPGTVILTCAKCGAPMDERKCKLICRCGYFLSCSDY